MEIGKYKKEGEYILNYVTYDNLKTILQNMTSNINSVTNDTPIGTIISYMGTTAPVDYLICDGTVYNISQYNDLANFIKQQFGSYNFFGGDGTTTFAVPDLRGEFLRGTGTNSHTNQGSGSNVGEHQDSTEIANGATNGGAVELWRTNSGNTGNLIKNGDSALNNGAGLIYGEFHPESASKPGNSTIRPTNTSVLYCIKYKQQVLSTPENNYSTEEQRIGTWIDGKPLYQITYSCTSPVNIESSESVTSIPSNITVYNISGMLVNSSGGYIPICLYWTSNNYISAYVDTPKSNIKMRVGATEYINAPVTITIQYTKTTD